MNAEEFRERARAIGSVVWGWLESMNAARGVKWTQGSSDGLIKDEEFYFDDCYGEAVLVFQTYSASGFSGMNFDRERTIKIKIGHTKEWVPSFRIETSIREKPLNDMVAPSDDALRLAIMTVHDDIFNGWPPSQEEIDEFIRGQTPDSE